MRNLKKILALALALVMSMSLMATANAFSDDEKITDTYETAVTVLSGLEVFQGYDDGSFQPQGAITRAEVAAIIYRIVTGDVNDTQKDIYADYNKFDDVKSTSWYAGYVNFCANAEYIKGYDAKTFGPNDRVTGYQALAMILRALGYDKNGEFTGTNWQVQTAAVGESQGITKNITAGTLGTPATREVVAEILFRAILVPKTTYTPAFGYQTEVNGKENTSIGWDTFELEDITGVVVANEYADLYSGSPMDEGETELNVDGESYTLAYATTVEDLGEARHAYVTGETVLAIADAGNTVWTNEGAEADIATSGKCESASGMERDGETEEYINFANETFEYVTDIRISYWLDTNENNVQDAGDETGVFRKDHELTTDEVEILEGIFEDDDKMDGWVVVGTKELDEKNDISNDMTWREFCREYFQDTDTLIEDVDGADNGEWLKVVDNDGDGVADYIFRIDFAMSVINRIDDDDEYTLASLDENDDVVSFTEAKIDGGDIITEDELAEGDVVIYTFIDGNYYMSVAEMVTETIDKKGINSKTETITCDGTDYVQSHIGYTDSSEYYWDVTDAHTEVKYDLYLDHFNYVRLFVESDYDTFMLLTDGWYENDNRTETFEAMYWNVEAEEEQQIDITNDADDFIYTGAYGEVETWGNLQGAEMTYLNGAYANPNRFATNIVGYSENADGYDLKSVESSAARIDYEVLNLTDAELHKSLKSRVLEGEFAIGDDDEARIQTSPSTQYYLVIRDEASRWNANGWIVEDVITWTGYANAPDEAQLSERVGETVGYAVTHKSVTGSNYYVADVVVFETVAYNDRDTYFVYEFNNWDDRDDVRVEHVWGIGYDDEGAIDDQRKDVEEAANTVWANGRIEFYEIYDNETAQYIGDVKGEYAAKHIYAGVANTEWDLDDDNYIQVSIQPSGYRYIAPETPIYQVSYDAHDNEYSVDTVSHGKISVDDKMILFTDGDGNVEYAIWVEGSTHDYDGDGKDDAILADLYLDVMPISASAHDNLGLWNRIAIDAQPVPYSDMLTVALKAATDALEMPETTVAERKDKVAALKAALAALEDLTSDAAMAAFSTAEKLELGAKIEEVEKAIVALGEVASDEETAQEMIDAWNGNAAGTVTDADMFEAAAAYKPNYGLNAEADEAYGKAQDEADALVDAVNNLDEKKLEDVAAAQTKVPVDANALTIADNSNDEVDNYNKKVKALEAAKADYDLAKALVVAYDAWDAVKDTATDSKVAELWKTLKDAYDKAEKADIANQFTDTDTHKFGVTNGSTYDEAVEGVEDAIDALPVDAVAGLALKTSGADLWKVSFENNVLVVGSGVYTDVTKDNIGTTYLEASDDAVYDTTITWEENTEASGDDYNVFTATFPGINGGKAAKVDVTVRAATDAEKVARDKAALEEALESLDALSYQKSADTGASDVAGRVETAIEGAVTNLWGTVEATVTSDAGYNGPTQVGNTASYTGSASIKITSGESVETITLTLKITVEKTA